MTTTQPVVLAIESWGRHSSEVFCGAFSTFVDENSKEVISYFIIRSKSSQGERPN